MKQTGKDQVWGGKGRMDGRISANRDFQCFRHHSDLVHTVWGRPWKKEKQGKKKGERLGKTHEKGTKREKGKLFAAGEIPNR